MSSMASDLHAMDCSDDVVDTFDASRSVMLSVATTESSSSSSSSSTSSSSSSSLSSPPPSSSSSLPLLPSRPMAVHPAAIQGAHHHQQHHHQQQLHHAPPPREDDFLSHAHSPQVEPDYLATEAQPRGDLASRRKSFLNAPVNQGLDISPWGSDLSALGAAHTSASLALGTPQPPLSGGSVEIDE